MAIPKRKNNIEVYGNKPYYLGEDIQNRRQELLDRITKSDSYLPDSILHDDLDLGMLDFIKKSFVVISDGTQIPVIDKILTIQRWAEFSNNWEFSDDDGNIKLPFIAVVRKPDVQPGSHPVTQRTIPDRKTFYYASVPTWNGSQMGADIYKIPQPVAVDISYEVSIVCNKFRDLNKFNKIVLQKFSSRQAYTTVKGHYIPIILESIDDSTPMDTLDGRRFYIQNYKFTLVGFLVDKEEFEVKPAISRFFLMNEFIESNNIEKKVKDKTVEIKIVNFTADGTQTQFGVGETISILFNVAVNGLVQKKGIDYFHISNTSKITFDEAPQSGSIVTITYNKNRNATFIDNYGQPLFVSQEYFTYNGLSNEFNTINAIRDIVFLDINGLVEEEAVGYDVINPYTVRVNYNPVPGSKIGILYLY
jgi:hypothetical protein